MAYLLTLLIPPTIIHLCTWILGTMYTMYIFSILFRFCLTPMYITCFYTFIFLSAIMTILSQCVYSPCRTMKLYLPFLMYDYKKPMIITLYNECHYNITRIHLDGCYSTNNKSLLSILEKSVYLFF